MALVKRNPFARTEVHRETVKLGPEAPADRTCDWCGNVRHNKRYPGNPPTLYQYSTQTDGGRVNTHKGLFCSLPCHNAYHRG